MISFLSSKTDALIVNKRYGYDKSKEKLTLYQGIDVLIEDNQPFHSPMNGQIVRCLIQKRWLSKRESS